MKKVLCVLMTMIMVMGLLSACAMAEEKQIVFTVMGGTVDPESCKEMWTPFKTYMESHPNVVFEWTGYETNDSQNRLLLLAEANALPDFSRSVTYITREAETLNPDCFLDFSAEFNADPEWSSWYTADQLSPCSSADGTKLYGVPYGVNMQCWWVNATKVKNLGFEFPETFDDMLAICKAAKESGDCGIMYCGPMDYWTDWGFQNFMSRHGFKDIYLDWLDGKVKLSENEEIRKAFEAMAALTPYLNDDAMSTGYGVGGERFFGTDEAAPEGVFFSAGTWACPSSPTDDEFVIWHGPTFPDSACDQTLCITQSLECVVVGSHVKDDPEKLAVALDFLKYYGGEEACTELAYYGSSISPTPNFKEDPSRGEFLPEFLSMIDLANDTRYKNVGSVDAWDGMPASFWETWGTIVAGTVSGQLTVDEALAQLDIYAETLE